MKTRIIEEKGKQFEPTASVDQIRNWMKNQRTMSGKLSNPRKKEAGSAAKPPTDREKSVLTSFTFLDAHITRIPSWASGKFGASSSSSEKDDDEDENEEDDEDDENVPSGDDVDVGDDNEEADESRDPTQGSQGQAETVVPQNVALPDLEEIFSVAGTSGAASSTSSTSKAQRGRQKKSGKRKKGQKTKKSVEDKELHLIQSLCQNVKSAVQSQAKKIPPSAEEAELASFASDVVASMRRIPPERWTDVKYDVFTILRNYSKQPTCTRITPPRQTAATSTMKRTSPLHQSWGLGQTTPAMGAMMQQQPMCPTSIQQPQPYMQQSYLPSQPYMQPVRPQYMQQQSQQLWSMPSQVTAPSLFDMMPATPQGMQPPAVSSVSNIPITSTTAVPTPTTESSIVTNVSIGEDLFDTSM